MAIDVEFRHHRTTLSQAYGRFITAMQRLQLTAAIQDPQQRNNEITSIRATISAQALADYENPEILKGLSSAAYLRRRECVWLIDQAVIMTYQLQGEFDAVTQYLLQLRKKILKDLRQAIDLITTQAELDFLFPEIRRIYHHDLPTLRLWLAYTKWQQKLGSSNSQGDEFTRPVLQPTTEQATTIQLSETEFYQQLKSVSHFRSLKDQLKLLIEPELRQKYQAAVAQYAAETGWKAITRENLTFASEMTITNLYHYFQQATTSKATG